MYKTVQLKQETHDLITIALNIMVKHHPDLKDVRVSRNKILYHVLKYYIEN